ncbi:MAG: ribosome silencing factor [Acidobacteriota bacterium]|nr:ribosome silencing factor [Blastocatellia bacterium]MDW8412573.1 ribosome silencing factor [Acidobacteriota bacterium]
MTENTTLIEGISDARLETVVACAGDKKAVDIVILDLREVAQFTDYFVICNGRSNRQVQAICEQIEEKLSQRGVRPLHIEGFEAARWILMDYGDFIVHIFDEEARKFYELERLWRDAPRIEIKG